MTKKIAFLVIIFTFFACGKKATAEAQTLSASGQKHAVTLPAYSELEGYPLDNKSIKVIKMAFVTDKQGVDIKQEPDENSKTLIHRDYGDRLEVIEDADGSFYGIRESIRRKWKTEKYFSVEGPRNEKVFVKKDALGNFSDIKLIPADLNVIASSGENGKMLDKYLKIELVDKQTFENQMNNKVDYFVADTANVRKMDGTIILHCAEKYVKLVDKPTDNDSEIYYDYQGQYEFLNQYVISMTGWEWYSYTFYDKTTGKEAADISFGEFPHISPDKQHIICIYENPYDETADVELYKIDGRKIKNIMSASYINWMPFSERINENEWEKTMFWASDGCFYLKANHSKIHLTERGDYNKNYQYLRIKLLPE